LRTFTGSPMARRSRRGVRGLVPHSLSPARYGLSASLLRLCGGRSGRQSGRPWSRP
jgi:hypothetical protein